jgi:hypothetical protein
MKTKIENDLGIMDEQFIETDELIGYANEAIDEAEAEVLGLYEDYFLSRATLTLVAAQEAYSLPTDIYAQKIRRVVYVNGSTIYEIKRLKDWKKFEIYAEENVSATNPYYQYMITAENAGAQSQLILVPRSVESGAYVTLWYLRNANRFSDDTSILDIPEAANFVMQFIKTRCYEKEGHPNLGLSVQALENQRQLLKTTLSSMVPDANNEIELNTSYYDDFN